MSEHTAIVSATYRILGEAEEYVGSFAVTADENTTTWQLRERINIAVRELDTMTAELGRGLLAHLSRNVAEPKNGPEDPHEDEQTDHGGWEDH